MPYESRLRRLLLPSWSTRKRILLREAWLVVFASYPIIAFAYCWPANFRNTHIAFVIAAWSAFIIRTFLFHVGIGYLAIAIAAAWARQRRLLLATMPLLIISLAPTLLEYLPHKPPAVTGETITVMSANLLMANKDTKSIISEIRAAAPDVLLLQEYTVHWHKALQEGIGSAYPHIAYVTRDDSFGAAIYSRRPFLERPQHNLRLGAASEPQMRAVIQISGTPVAFYNIHPLPPSSISYVTESRLQIADLADILRAERLPAIISGDFNFTENSPQYDLLTNLGFTESHTLASWGRGSTWPVTSFWRWIPGLRLDRIFLSPTLAAVESHTGVGQGSDHRPIIARIGLREQS
jgi:endonuclease/exonuclease/phosphatase (EEP) superfamily protein YafD